MFEGRHRDGEVRPRLLRGERNWWFLGSGGVAKLYPWHIGEDGNPSPETTEWLHAQGMYRTRLRRTYSLTVLTTTHCNLGCAYCFQNVAQDTSGGTSPPRIGYARLNSATIAKTIEFTRQRMAEGGFTGLQITLFGGEPLLNPRGCVDVLEAAAPLRLVSADMVTNGTLLDVAQMRRLNELGLRSLQITFDGDQPDHDASRVKRTGGGTFDTIVSNLRALQDEGLDLSYSLRVNVTAQNIEGIDRLTERLAKRLDASRTGIYFKIVGDVGIGFENRVPSEDLARRFIEWNRRVIALGFRMGRPREKAPCPACSFSGGTTGAVVSADGSLSSCWETAGKPEWRVGDIVDGYRPEHVGSRWRTCEESFQNFSDTEFWDSLRDRVDAVLMDDLAALGRL
jgi:uncharacterized protein